MDVLLANLFYETQGDRTLIRAMPVMISVLCILAIAYRYYSRFLAYRVIKLDDSRITPAHRLEDGNNFHPTNRWVLFGHHFAAISGAGPLIGPVLAMQYGYAPGLMWLVIGVCLGGAVQDMLVMAASVRRDGKSLAEIARIELGPVASVLASLAILFIVIIALAGLAFVVVKALGGETAKLPPGMRIVLPADSNVQLVEAKTTETHSVFQFPTGCEVNYAGGRPSKRPEGFIIRVPASANWTADQKEFVVASNLAIKDGKEVVDPKLTSTQEVPGSSWGTFTIACTIPIALFVGLWMYRIRPGKVIEASIIGGIAVLGAVVLGAYIPDSPLRHYFELDRESTILALGIYGFIAAIMPVWLLLTPRDYLSSFMKIGTLGLLILGVIFANPVLQHPPINETFREGGPTFPGGLFPFVFICVMCGAISGFHSLVSSGTTPKMINKESDIRMIGYGAMLTEGIVALVALIAAAAMPTDLYYAINTDIEKVPIFEKKLADVEARYAAPEKDPMHLVGVRDVHQLDLAQLEESVGGESLRGRTGGAVTLAVSMAQILTSAFSWADGQMRALMKYWYHFAIMFEALFILTTIDAGTRIARYLFQESLGKIYAPFARTNWLPGVLISSAFVTCGWCFLVHSGQIATIWPMFGIANQLLAALALAVITTYLIHIGQGKYAWVTILPMLFVTFTTITAGSIMIRTSFSGLNQVLALFVMVCVCTLQLVAVARWITVWLGSKPKSL
jgi:carbon starvation protein